MNDKEILTHQIAGQSLKNLAIRNVSWTTISTIVTTGLWFIINIVLARLLTPEDFGLVGLSSVFVSLANTVNQLGFTAAIIQRKDLGEEQLSTAFWVNLLVGFSLTVLLTVFSGSIANFYEQPELKPVMMVVSTSFFFSSLGSIHRALLMRNIQFKDLALLDMLALFASAVSSIGFAKAGGGVYSLAIQEVVRSAVRALLGWVFSSWSPLFVFDWGSFRPLFSFSSTVLVSDLLAYVSANMDRFLIGKLIGVAEVGYYNLGYSLVRLPLAKISPLINKASYPILARVQGDLPRLHRGYLKTIQYISLLSFPALLGLFVVAPEFISVFYGPQWIPSIPLLRFLCGAGMVLSIATTIGSFLFPCNRPDLVLLGNVLRIPVACFSILLGSKWGVIGVTIGVTMYIIGFLFPMYLWSLRKAGQMQPLAVFQVLTPAFFSSILMAIMVSVSKLVILKPFELNNIFTLLICVLLGGVTYSLSLFLFYRSLFLDIYELISSIIDKRSK